MLLSCGFVPNVLNDIYIYMYIYILYYYDCVLHYIQELYFETYNYDDKIIFS